jgi:hypothetical protein
MDTSQLPLEYPVRDALRIYLKRLLLILMVIAVNSGLLGFIFLASKLLPIVDESERSSFVGGICYGAIVTLGVVFILRQIEMVRAGLGRYSESFDSLPNGQLSDLTPWGVVGSNRKESYTLFLLLLILIIFVGLSVGVLCFIFRG